MTRPLNDGCDGGLRTWSGVLALLIRGAADATVGAMHADVTGNRTLHLGLRVTDLERSLAFWTGLGYERLGTVPETPFGSLTMLALPGDEFASVELAHDPEGEPVVVAGFHHLVVRVGSMTDTVAALGERGIGVEPPQSPDGSDDFWTAWVTDPDGYRIELVQWPAGHPDGMTAADLSGAG